MKYAVIVVLMAGTAGLHTLMVRSHDEEAHGQAPPLVSIPANIGGYRQQGDDIPAVTRVKEILQTSSILTRNYVSSENGLPIQLTIVSAMTSRASLHFPEVCLVGAGFEIGEQSMTQVGFFHSAKRIVIIKGDEKQAVLYWFQTGDRLTGNFFLNSWYWIWDTVRFKQSATSLIKVSAPIRQDKEAVFHVLEDFAAALAPVLVGHQQ